MIVSRGGVVVEIPENVALLPLREKEKYIVELRKQGKTYREIVKILRVSPSTVARVLKQYAREREINELREKLRAIEEKLKELEESLSALRRSYKLMVDHALWRRSNCRYYGSDGYCSYWTWRRRVEEWKMKEEVVRGERVYRISVEEHAEYCATCPAFTRK